MPPNGKGLPQWSAYDAQTDVLLDFTLDGPVGKPDPWKEHLDLIEHMVTPGRKGGEDAARAVAVRLPGVAFPALAQAFPGKPRPSGCQLLADPEFLQVKLESAAGTTVL